VPAATARAGRAPAHAARGDAPAVNPRRGAFQTLPCTILRMTTKMPMDDPNYLWSRAEEARTMAEQIRDVENKRLMMGVAETFEVLARRAEARRPKSV
jgi:hypothetical protein